MQAPGMDYRALRDIMHNGVAMARAGDLIHEAHVTGPDAWLILGADVEIAEGATVPPPARNAPASAWEAFLASRGFDAAELGAMGRDQMIAAWDKSQEPPEPEPAAGKPPRRSGSGGQGDDASTQGSTS